MGLPRSVSSGFRFGLALVAGVAVVAACEGGEGSSEPARAFGEALRSWAAKASIPADPSAAAGDGTCPPEMVHVEGKYCPEAAQKCLALHDEFLKELDHKRDLRAKQIEPDKGTASERCLEYESPSVCLSKERREVSYCMDRYEWPNQKGVHPRLLTTWLEARDMCAEAGKRLCTEDEFNFACEGEEMLPYTYGYKRDANVCNIDKPYRMRKVKVSRWDNCQADPKCKEEIDRLNQSHGAGEMDGCVSPEGVYDLNGNANEWVEVPGAEPPTRSGLKGGWWGPVRGRCRPTVRFHKENDWGYEVGFRCCKDAGETKKSD